MTAAGIQSDLKISVAGRDVRLLGAAQLEEDLLRGSGLRFRFDPGAAAFPELGEKVDLTLSVDDAGVSGELQLSLWCFEVSVIERPHGREAEILAADPLSFCQRGVQFKTYPGKVPLHRLAVDILAAQPLRAKDAPQPSAPSTTISLDWLLQCQETGRDFLQRVARMHGQVIYWRRSEWVIGSLGQDPSSPVADATLSFDQGLVESRLTRLPPHESQQFAWIDPESRTAQRVSFRGGAGRPLQRRAATVVRPHPQGESASGLPWASGDLLMARTLHPELVVGSRVSLPDGSPWLIESITHWLDPNGSYHNSVLCTPPALWAMRGRGVERDLIGLFQATIKENADPSGLGRVRVVLTDDPEQRPSPWIPLLNCAAGPETGWHWIPDKGELVFVVCESACPENLVCLGAIRGKDRNPKAAWRSNDNARKVLSTGQGLEIVFDEGQQSIRLATRGSAIELCGDGQIKLIGKQVEVKADHEISLEGGTHIGLDATRIDLGK